MPKSNSVSRDVERQVLNVKWKDGTSSEIGWRLKLAPNYNLEGVEYIGNYAVQLRWGDGHSYGLYTWNYLRELAGLMPKPQ
jgi:DUF971 family protein